MMILSKEQYKAMGGMFSDIPDYEQVELTAESVIDALLCFALTKGTLNDSDPMWNHVLRAIAMQIDYIMQNGGLEAYFEEDSDVELSSESASEGGVSQTMTYLAGGERPIHAAGHRASKKAVAFLGSVGLMYRVRIVRGGFR
jgi:hypothetical protein